MLVRILIYIKHHFSFLWQTIEWMNAVLFRFLHGQRFKNTVTHIIKKYGEGNYLFKPLEARDLASLHAFIRNQSPNRLEYFKPHGFDEKSLEKTFKNPSFLMMGAFDGQRLVGYFFLRCFWNKKCFVGRLIDELYEGKGIGRTMNNIMYNIAWESEFHCMSTISKNNHWVMRSHANNPLMKVIKELDNDFLLVEFVESKSRR